MYMLKKGDVIGTVYEAEWPLSGRPSKDHLAFRAEIAKRLLAAESDAYRHDLRQEVEDIHARDLQAYAAERQLCPRTSEETQQKYVALFLSYFFPRFCSLTYLQCSRQPLINCGAPSQPHPRTHRLPSRPSSRRCFEDWSAGVRPQSVRFIFLFARFHRADSRANRASIHGGRATGKRTWPAVEGKSFTEGVMHSFTRYLMQTSGASPLTITFL